MRITRHTAPDMRQALRAVRGRLGPDAVILSSRRTAEGVEVTAAMDFDAESWESESQLIASAEPVLQERPPAAPAPDEAAAALPAAAERTAAPAPRESVAAAPPVGLQAADEFGATALATHAMGHELKALRRMLETQLAQLAWTDLTRRAPVHTELLRELTEIGIARELAAEIAGRIAPGTELTQARRLGVAAIAQRVVVTGDRWLEEGGRIALIGPTGVGKTTTLAKLAVRWALRHGARDLALIAADAGRIGAQDQVRSLGQLLGAPVHALEDFSELPGVLARLGQCRLILIDTPGSSQRDAQLAGRMAALAACAELQTALVLAASTQAGALAETVARFAPAAPGSCVLTKMDEAASLGGALSVLMRARLPISYVSEGQRVPEDLRPARALELVSSAVQLAQMSGATADEDLLKRRFGEFAHALA